MSCSHRPGGWEWAKIENGILKIHPYCSKCGTFKNVSSNRGKKFSYFVEALSRLRKMLERRGYKISDAQIRLIMKDLSEMEGFCDTWWITFSRQKTLFFKVVKRYVRVSSDLLESVLGW